jgi:hypothetical protein
LTRESPLHRIRHPRTPSLEEDRARARSPTSGAQY